MRLNKKIFYFYCPANDLLRFLTHSIGENVGRG